MLTVTTVLLLSYLCGAVPTSILMGRLHGVDIRQVGSGNAGATNVMRTLGKGPGLLVLLIDALKGFLPTLLLPAWQPFGPAPMSMGALAVLCGLAAMLGHIYTVFAGFKGGKGVATGAGMLLALIPWAILVAVGVFALVVWRSRYVSLGSILSTASIPLTLTIQQFGFQHPIDPAVFWFCAFVPFFIAYTHRENIQRLRAGTEKRIGAKEPGT